MRRLRRPTHAIDTTEEGVSKAKPSASRSDARMVTQRRRDKKPHLLHGQRSLPQSEECPEGHSDGRASCLDQTG